VWRYEVGGLVVEKRVLMPHVQNTVHVAYRLARGEGTARLALRPAVHFRRYETPVDAPPAERYQLTASADRWELSAGRTSRRCGCACLARVAPSAARGRRSLAPGHPDHKPRYDGDLRTRDATYHQGTVWAWPIGPCVDAWLKVHPDDRAGAPGFLEGLARHANATALAAIGSASSSAQSARRAAEQHLSRSTAMRFVSRARSCRDGRRRSTCACTSRR